MTVEPNLVVFAGVLVTGVIGVAGFVMGNNRNESKARGGIYRRMDENKKDYNDTFQRKDICEVTHKVIADSLTEIKCDVKKLLKKNGVN